MIAEDGVPFTVILPADIDILRLGIAEIVEIECTIGIQFLGIFHADGVSRVACWREGNPSCHVLLEVVDVIFASRRNRQGLHAHARSHLGAQGSKRYLSTLSLQPRFVIEVRHVPTVHLLAGIIYLTIIFVVRTNRAVGGNLPFFVGRDTLGCTIRELDEDINAAFGQSEDGCFIRLVLAHGEHSPIAQHKTDGILFLECFGDVVGVIKYCLAIVGRHGDEHLTVIGDSIHMQFMQSDTSHVCNGTLDGLCQFKLLADIACCQPAV